MNKPLLLCALAALAAFGQSQTPLTITQSAGSATGELRMQERRTNGQDYVGIRAPQSVAANTVWTLPSADGTSGQCLQTDGAGSWRWAACGGTVSMPSYDWSQAPGGSIAVGANTITLTPCPASVDGTNSGHYVYLSGGTGTAEYVLITGGTCTSGAATGTIQFTAANTHTGGWAASSASDGLQEALYSVADGARVAVVVPEGSYNIYATVSAGTRPVTVACASLGAIFSVKSNSITLLDSRSGTGPQVSNCTFRNDDSMTGVTAIYSNSADGPSSGGAFAGRIENNWFVNFDKSIHSVTTNGWHIVGNHIISSPGYNATAAIHTESLTNGDQGTGLIAGNIITCSATCTYGLLWNGPGALQLKHNNFNGYTTQVHLQPAFGTASASGSTVTWQSGNKFRTNWVGTTIYVGSTGRTIASVDSDTKITTSTSIGTISTTDFYINQSSQVSVMSNNFDAGTNTQYGVRWTGAVPFQNAQVESNFFSNWSAVNNHQAITIESGTNLNFLGIRNNHIQSSGGTAVYGIRVKSGYGYAVENNQVAGSTTGVSLETTSLYPKASGNQCILIGTACLTSTDATAEIMESQSVTYAELAALSAASGSRVYCSNCSAVCATAGTGAIASRVNGSWVCSDGTSSRWTLSGSNIYRASQVGIGAAPVSTTALSISGGSGANELYIADASSTTAVQVIAENGYGVVGTYSNHPLIFAADSAGRWRLTAAGTLQPEADDTYDIGTSSTSPNAIYSHAVSAIAASGDYVRTRKLEVHMDGTGSSFFNWSFGTSNTLDLLDTASGVIQRWDRNTSDVSFDAHVWPRGTTETRNLGLTSARWLAINTKNLNLSGNVTSNLTPSGTRDLGATGSEWNGLYAGSAVITSIIEPKVNGGAQSGDTAKRWSNVYSQAGNFSGLVTIAGTAGTNGLDLSTYDRYLDARVLRNSQSGTDKDMYFGYFSGATSSLYFHANNAEVMRVTGTGISVTGTAVATGLTINTGAATVGYCWTATSTGGAGSWQACSGGSSLPVADTTNIVKGSADTSKLLRFEVDGFTTATTRTLTPQNNSYTIAGTDISQTFSSTQTFSGTLSVSGTVGDDFIPNSDGTYVNGTASFRWGSIATYNADFNGVVTLQSGSTITGSILPTTNNLYALGNTSYRWSNVATVNMNLSGTITAPNGNTGLSATKTVGDGAGGSCTITISGGIITASTCP